MVRAGSTIEIYVLRYTEGENVDVFFRASSVDNAIVTGVRKALKIHLKNFVILDSNYGELFYCARSGY